MHEIGIVRSMCRTVLDYMEENNVAAISEIVCEVGELSLVIPQYVEELFPPVAEGTPLELKNGYTGDFITLYGASEDSVKALGAPYTPMRDAFRIMVPDTAAATELIIKHPEIFRDYEITKGKMDDVFLAVTGKALEGGEGR